MSTDIKTAELAKIKELNARIEDYERQGILGLLQLALAIESIDREVTRQEKGATLEPGRKDLTDVLWEEDAWNSEIRVLIPLNTEGGYYCNQGSISLTIPSSGDEATLSAYAGYLDHEPISEDKAWELIKKYGVGSMFRNQPGLDRFTGYAL